MKHDPTTRKGAGSLVLLLCFLMSVLLPACGSPASGAASELDGTAVIRTYYTYGAFFQAEGTADLSSLDGTAKGIQKAALQLRTGNGEEDRTSFEIPFSVSKGKLSFRTAKHLDEGLCLDTLETGDTAVFLELTRKDGSTDLLALSDGTGTEKTGPQDAIEYYTLPYGHHGHRRVTSAFERTGTTETLVFHTKRSRLPSDVYDIVVDPGHGGKDPGAQSGPYKESDVVLDIGKKVANALESAGYKVLLTRDGTEDPNMNMAYTEYDKDGRVNRTCGSRAKLCLSLHLNQNKHGSQNGVQIYRAWQAGDDFAKSLADELVAATALDYSTMGGRTAKGVYVRTFSNRDLAAERSKARKKGYTFYDATTSTDYYFMIREYGCLATGAYVDGRNPAYGTNEYRDFPQGVESCLCELGFLSNEHDRGTLLNDQRGIAKALTRAVDAYIATLHETPGPQTADLLAKESL